MAEPLWAPGGVCKNFWGLRGGYAGTVLGLGGEYAGNFVGSGGGMPEVLGA